LKNVVTTDTIRIDVNGVYNTSNNGFNIKIGGLKCVDTDEIKKEVDIEFSRLSDSKVIILKCNSNVLNTMGIKTKIDDKTKVFCSHSCKNMSEYEFYGNDIFSGDSSICRSAYYKNIISEDGGEFIIQVLKGEKEYLKGAKSNPVCYPEDKNEPFSISYKLIELGNVKEIAMIDIKANDEIDYKDDTLCWIRSKVESIENKNGSLLYNINVNGKIVSIQSNDKDFHDKVGKCGSRTVNQPCTNEV